MTYSEIITDICARVNDPLKERLDDRAKDHFISAIYGIIDSGEYELDDIPAYYKVNQNLSFTDNEYSITGDNVYHILEVFPDPTIELAADDRLRIEMKDINIIGKMANNPELRPAAEDMFVYRVGNTLYSIDGDNASDYTGAIYMTYIENFDNDWNDSDDLSEKFSNKIIKRAINIASVALLKEDSL